MAVDSPGLDFGYAGTGASLMTPAEVEATLAGLQQRRSGLVVRQDGIAAERQRVALAGETGDAEASAVLDSLDSEDILLGQRLKRVDAAITGAQQRLAAARRAEALAADRAALAQVTPLTERLRERAGRMDALAAEMVAEAHGFVEDVRTLHRAGFAHPTDALMMVNFGRAALSAFMASPMKTEHVPPGERHTFTELAAGWTQRIDAEVSARLTATKAAA